MGSVAIVINTIATKTIAIDDYVLDVLMRDLLGHDKSPSAFAVYLFLWRRARAEGEWSTRVSHKGIADDTGLSKSAVQAAIRHLNRRKLIRSVRESATATPEHHVLRPWASRQRTGTPRPT
jgi:DNA-binding MarR family transcriptional regulator